MTRSPRLSVLGFEECGLVGASTGGLAVHADRASFLGAASQAELTADAYGGPGSPVPTLTLIARVGWPRSTPG